MKVLCYSVGFMPPFIERGVESLIRSELGTTPRELYEQAATVCSTGGLAEALACALYGQLAHNLWRYRFEIATVSVFNRAALEFMPGGKCLEIILNAERGQMPGVLNSVDCVVSAAGPIAGTARPAIRAVVLGADVFVNCAPLIEALQEEGPLRDWESSWNTVGCTSAALDIASARIDHLQAVHTSGPSDTGDLASTLRNIEVRTAQRRQYLDSGQAIPVGTEALRDILNDIDEIEQQLRAIPTVYHYQ